MTRELALCADDFGQSAGIDRGILQLARRGRISAVSCMVNGPAWAADAKTLREVQEQNPGGLQVGLHFNLTEGRPMSASLARLWPRLPALRRLIALAHLGRLPQALLGEELRAQWAEFERCAGRSPQHLDGHQHVHHLPGVREALLRAARTHAGISVRNTRRVLGPGHGLKRALIELTGGRTLGRELERSGREANTALLGVYDFIEPDYGSLMRRWLAALPARGALIFCHPGQTETPTDDAIAAARARELVYLDSEAFTRDLADAGVSLVRNDGLRRNSSAG